MVVQSILPGCRQQFIDGDKDHDPCYSGKDKSKEIVGQKRHQDEPGEQGANGFGQSRKERKKEALFFTSCTV